MAIIKREERGASSPTRGLALRMTRANPQLAAAVSKAVDGQNGASYNQQGNRAPGFNEFYAFYQALTRRAQHNSDAEAVKKMLPDVELAEQILVSSILSPKDMMTTELIYSASSDEFQADLLNSLINRVKQHFTIDYPIEKHLMDMVREPLFTKGSYPIAVIPENAIDAVINGTRAPSMESFDRFYDRQTGAAKGIGILGKGTAQTEDQLSKQRFGVSLETFNLKVSPLSLEDQYLQYSDTAIFGVGFEKSIVVTDNPMALKTGQVLQFMQKKRIGTTYSTAMESAGAKELAQINDRSIERAMIKYRPQKQEQVVEIPNQHQISRKSVGMPLVMKLPSESVIPVHVPGNPERHVGYYVILDENGNPVYAPETDLLNPGTLNQSGTTNAQSNLIQRASMNLGMADTAKFDMHNYQHMQAAVRVYGDMVERDLINRIRNGALGINVQVSRNEEIYRLMLSRTLARRHTQVLYLPVEYMTYIAFKYGPDGVGRSLLDDQAMLSMFRTTMLFAEVVGSIKNSIGRTKVSGTIPENDPDPLKTMETIVHEIVQSRRLNIPMGVSQPADVMNFVQQAAFEFNWSGHPGMPDLKLDFEQVQSNYQKPDTDLSEKLRKSSIMGFGISPETVDNGFNTEFATTALANNVLLSKRVIMWQNVFTPQLTQHMRQHARFSEQLITDLLGILKQNKDKILLDMEKQEGVEIAADMQEKILIDFALARFLETFTVTLPQPSSVTLESQNTELENYGKMLDTALESYITSDMFTETTAGQMSGQAGTIKAMLKAYFMRKFMADKGILSELANITAVDDEGKPQSDISKEIQAHIESLTKAGVITLVNLKINRQAADKDLESIGATDGPEGSSSTSSGGDMGGGDGGFGDFGDDNPQGPDDTTLVPVDGAEASPTSTDEPPADEAAGPAKDDTAEGKDKPADQPEEGKVE